MKSNVAKTPLKTILDKYHQSGERYQFIEELSKYYGEFMSVGCDTEEIMCIVMILSIYINTLKAIVPSTIWEEWESEGAFSKTFDKVDVTHIFVP